MKKDLMLSSGLLILLIVMISATIFLPAGATIITGSAKFDPNVGWNISSGPPAALVNATIRFDSGQGANPRDINASTILLEGTVPPLTTTNVSGGVMATFWGVGVYNVLSAKVGHMGTLSPPWKVWLVIEGKIKNGTAFSVTGYLRVNFPKYPPPP